MAVRFSNKQKAAAVLIAIGEEEAASIYQHLKDTEIEELTFEILKLNKLRSEDMDSALKDFYKLCVAQKYITEGGKVYAKNVLEKAFGSKAAASLISRVNISSKTDAFAFLKDIDSNRLINALVTEHPQTIALILSYATTEQASAVITELPVEKKVQVIQRIATIDKINPETVRTVGQIFSERMMSKQGSDLMNIGGIDYTAEIIGAIDTKNEKVILDELQLTDPELAEEIVSRMFTFDDVFLLTDIELQKVLRQIDTQDLVYVLKMDNDRITETIMSNISKRLRETLESELSYVSAASEDQIIEAQAAFVTVAKALEAEGEIVIKKGRR